MTVALGIGVAIGLLLAGMGWGMAAEVRVAGRPGWDASTGMLVGLGLALVLLCGIPWVGRVL